MLHAAVTYELSHIKNITASRNLCQELTNLYTINNKFQAELLANLKLQLELSLNNIEVDIEYREASLWIDLQKNLQKITPIFGDLNNEKDHFKRFGSAISAKEALTRQQKGLQLEEQKLNAKILDLNFEVKVKELSQCFFKGIDSDLHSLRAVKNLIDSRKNESFITTELPTPLNNNAAKAQANAQLITNKNALSSVNSTSMLSSKKPGNLLPFGLNFGATPRLLSNASTFDLNTFPKHGSHIS